MGRGIRRKLAVLLAVAGLAAAVSACAPPAGTEPRAGPPAARPDAGGPEGGTSPPHLTVHFIDVGQGDATLLQGPDFTILIDAGRHDGDEVVPYLESVGVTALDLVVGTHPHSDHVGQLARVLERFPVAEVWLSGDVATSRTFERTVDAIEASGAAYHEPRAGEVFGFGSARLEVVNPAELTGDFHEGSVGLRVVFGEVAFLFTGDAEAPTEAAMVARGHTLRAQVLQLGHHGSRTSSSPAFLRAVAPEVAVYSAGAGNAYGHPAPEVLARLARLGVTVYGTDVHGTIRVITDGKAYQVQTERSGESSAAEALAAGF